MFERYTEKARRVIFFARYEASQFGAPAIGPEHLLLGLMREDKTLTRRFLTRAQANLEAIRKEIESRAPLREKISTSVELPLAADTKRVLQHAHEESDRLQHRHIGTEHLLLGLLREERSVAAEILYERGLRLNAVREEIARATGTDPQPTGSSVVKSGYRTTLGVEILLRERADLLRGARIGLICNQASVDHDYNHAADLFKQSGFNLAVLFGPQHGIRGDVQDNMVETPHTFDEETGVRVFSLYSETREPSGEMLKDVDVLVFDMQDVGCRIYTFAYTLANCMRSAKTYGKRVIVCDRPNPIGGERVAGTVLDINYASFVGQYPIPTRHGMTIGELALYFNDTINCDLQIVEMRGWERDQWLDDGDAPWVMPSPNMPTLETATVFPGTVHLEGTQMSEGRGTTRPFELAGAPYINAAEYARSLERIGLSGTRFRAAYFQPTFQKHAGQTSGGVQIHVLDRESFEPVITGIAIVKTAYDMYGEYFDWKSPPYEYVYDKNPFDIISGTDKLREAIERGDSLDVIEGSWREGIEDFNKQRERFLIY